MTDTRKAVVIFDTIGWSTPIVGTVPLQSEHHVAYRSEDGEPIDLPSDEFDRLEALGAVAAPGKAAAAAEAALRSANEPVAEGDEGDSLIASWSAADTIAYVTQFPSEKARINALEGGRSTPRTTVLDASTDDPGA